MSNKKFCLIISASAVGIRAFLFLIIFVISTLSEGVMKKIKNCCGLNKKLFLEYDA